MSYVLREAVRLCVCGFSTDNVFFLESVEDGLTNVFHHGNISKQKLPQIFNLLGYNGGNLWLE